jgi:hypothetical protein
MVPKFVSTAVQRRYPSDTCGVATDRSEEGFPCLLHDEDPVSPGTRACFMMRICITSQTCLFHDEDSVSQALSDTYSWCVATVR